MHSHQDPNQTNFENQHCNNGQADCCGATCSTEAADKPAANNGASSVNGKIEALEKALAEAQEKAQTNWDKALRTAAEIENVRRRAEKDVESAHKFAVERFSQALLGVVDSLEKALEVKAEGGSVQALREGIEMTYKLFLDTLAKFGVEQLNPVGAAFNPDLHEAIAMVPNPDVASGMVITVYQKGYRLNGRVVRAARVVVSQ